MRVCLQTQNRVGPACAGLYCSGPTPVPLCEPSQKGCFLLSPQAHHQYVLSVSTDIVMGSDGALLELSIDMASTAPG